MITQRAGSVEYIVNSTGFYVEHSHFFAQLPLENVNQPSGLGLQTMQIEYHCQPRINMYDTKKYNTYSKEKRKDLPTHAERKGKL